MRIKVHGTYPRITLLQVTEHLKIKNRGNTFFGDSYIVIENMEVLIWKYIIIKY